MGYYLIIHIIGAIVALAMSIWSWTKKFDLTLECLLIYTTLSILFSWITALSILICDNSDKVIIRRRK